MNFFTADYHLNHDKINDFCNRPFKDLDHMNNELIKRHNERVGKRDTVFHIGDFCFGRKSYAEEFLDRLNGTVILLSGNHDPNNGVKSIIDYICVRTYGMDVLLTHKQERAYELREQFDFCLVGHSHEEWKFKERMCNVGVDVWGYYPIHMQQILKAYKKEYGK